MNDGAVLAGSLSSSPEARLIAVYRAIAAGDRQALPLAAALVRDVPGFQLGQLVYGDLLMAQSGTLPSFATVKDGPPAVREQLQKLRAEATRRLGSLREMPPPGTVPEQVLELARNVRHVVVVDASHSRVYVFEQQSGGLQLIRSFYASIGRAGYDKEVEGDLRTPLGVYHITSRLDDQQVEELYGIGALPLNYPNEHDRRMGRTGSGIWLHGVPRVSYARSPYATEGCVALANDDMAYLMEVLQTRRTPVVIANEVNWVRPADQAAERRSFETLLTKWQEARARGDARTLLALQTADFNARVDNPLRKASLDAEPLGASGELDPQADWRQVSVFRWKRGAEVTIVNYTVVSTKPSRSADRRQYWAREQGRWRLFFDGAV
ncbi:MAG: L,D-transpeptidase [Hydrogenophaga sp.]|uniref:L,D-transpeptidase family protein n=1 Tax=Hydrogenophaga sp. TaxID=1904254 RepID=UPI002734F0A0|nr:L,D-transpeptidase [Hydrogenophaga sp.]MDP3345564.1 L,D-transpeptidase [Hydrogenophaga sp.]MDP3926745.1 L,D-transpeptidase [Hydrogenophaga sp.]